MSELIAWTSIETNGLSWESWDLRLLEIGVYVVNGEDPFKFRGAVNHIIDPGSQFETKEWRLGRLFETMTPEAFEKHEASGLNDHYRNTSVILSPTQVEEDVIDLLSRYGEPGEFVFAGRDVWRDRYLLGQFMPGLADWYGDTLDIDNFSRVLAYAGVPEPELPDLSHRAVHDAQRHCEEFLYYVDIVRRADKYVEPETVAFLR